MLFDLVSGIGRQFLWSYARYGLIRQIAQYSRQQAAAFAHIL
jgi:hypothetical protein